MRFEVGDRVEILVKPEGYSGFPEVGTIGTIFKIAEDLEYPLHVDVGTPKSDWRSYPHYNENELQLRPANVWDDCLELE